MKIYVVIGATGEYSDHIEWPVKALVDEQDAKYFVELVSAEARAVISKLPDDLDETWDDPDGDHCGRAIPRGLNKYDPEMDICRFSLDRSVNYYYWEVELESSPIPGSPYRWNRT